MDIVQQAKVFIEEQEQKKVRRSELAAELKLLKKEYKRLLEQAKEIAGVNSRQELKAKMEDLKEEIENIMMGEDDD